MAKAKISQLNPKGSNLSSTDLFEVSVQTGSGYDTYSITGQEIVGGVSSGFVPYTGATQDVDLGANKLSAESIYIEGTNGNGHLHLKHQNSDATATGQSTALWANSDGDIKWKNDNDYKTTLKTSLNTADRVYTFPNTDCTLVPNGAITTSGLTMATSRLLGRTTASNGAVEEISIGTGLTLSGGTLSSTGGITVGTTSVTSGTDGRVFFQAGGVVQQDAAFFWDNTNKRLGVGATPSTSVRLDVRAQGALSTDIAFRVRNSADTANLVTQQGDGMFIIGSGTLDTNDAFFRVKQGTTNYVRLTTGGGVAIGAGSQLITASATPDGVAIGTNASATSSGGSSWSVAVGRTTTSLTSCVAIGGNVSSGTFSGPSIGIGSSITSSGIGTVVIGSSSSTGNLSNSVVLIGDNVNIGATNYNRIHSLGSFISHGASAINNVVTLGGGTGTGANLAVSTIADSFNVYLGATQRSFFVNKNTNMVLKSLGALVSGTDFEAAATNTITIHNGTAPVANIANAFGLYSADIVAGNAAPHFRTENGDIIKLYKETTAVTASTLVGGGGTTLTDTDTFDGYTIKQVVKALRNLGILA